MELLRLQKHWKWTQHWLSLASQVSDSPYSTRCDSYSGCVRQHFTPFVVWLDNAIGDAGVKHLADMLKVNTTLTRLVLNSELCFICFCSSVFRCRSYSEWMCLLRYRHSHWRRRYQSYCRSVESEFNIAWYWVTAWVISPCVFFFVTSHRFVSRN